MTTLDGWELLRWIVLKTLEGTKLYAKGEWAGRQVSGQLLPHSIDRTQKGLTRCLLVDILTGNGTCTIHCRKLTHIDLLNYD